MKKLLTLITALMLAMLLLASCDMPSTDGGGGGSHEHTWGEWIAVANPTCSSVGLERRICSEDSSHVESREVEKLEHTHIAFSFLERRK